MPKTFTDSERAYIRRRLLEEGKQCLSQFGLRKTTVDELVRRANIPKGTFYLFYDSKELLFFDVFMAFQNEIQTKLISDVKRAKGALTPDILTEIILGLFKMADDSFLLKFMADGEMELLFRKLPPETAAKHAEIDDFCMEHLVSAVPNMSDARIRAFSAALRGVFVSLLFRREVGDDIYEEALEIMVRGVVLQMFEGEAV